MRGRGDGFSYIDIVVDPGTRGFGRIRAGKLKYIASGGQGHVYEYRYRGSRYIVKVFWGGENPADRISAIYSRLIDWRRRTGKRFPEPLARRALPVAIGRTDTGHTVLIYNYLEDFTPLDKVLDPGLLNQRYGLGDRLGWVYDALRVFTVLEEAGVLLSDISPDNFALARGDGGLRVYLVDLEGASPLNQLTRFPPYFKRVPIFMPLDIEYRGFRLGPVFSDEKALAYHDLWYGLQLAAAMLTGLSPFEWLSNTHYTPRGYAEAIEVIEKHGAGSPTWPPVRDERVVRLMAARGIIDYDAYLYQALIFDNYPRLAAVLHTVFYRSIVEARERPPVTYTRISRILGVA